VQRRIERQRRRAGQRRRVGGGLRLAARDPENAVVHDERTAAGECRDRQRDLNQHDTGLRMAPVHGFFTFVVAAAGARVEGASTRPPPPSSALPRPSPGFTALAGVSPFAGTPGSGGICDGSSGETRCGVINTSSSVFEVVSFLLLKIVPTTGIALRNGIDW